MHDTIMFYAKNADNNTWTWPMEPKAPGTPKYKRWNVIDPATGKKITKSDKSVIVTETAMRDVFNIPRLQSTAKERSGWAMQKPVALYSRLILAATDAGDVVIYPFCGCATTLVAAENAGRKWIGIDRDKCAGEMVVQQLTKLNEGTEDWLRKVIVRDDLSKKNQRRQNPALLQPPKPK